jgi:tripartite-type tricarboxylate transporter receptor subunit TctC
MLTELMAGRVEAGMDNIPSSLAFIREGKLRAVATTGAARSSVLPEVPTLDEAGVKGFEATAWFGILAPAGTPPAVAQKLRDAVAKAVSDKGVIATLAKQGMEPLATQPTDWLKYMQSEIATYSKIIKDANIKQQ